MRAQITKDGGYRCAPEGHTVVTFERLSIVTGKVAEWAVADGAAKQMLDHAPQETAAMRAVPEVKRKRGRPRKVAD